MAIQPEKLKDEEARQALMNQADVVFLCLPDQAAREAVELIHNPHTVVIDTSTCLLYTSWMGSGSAPSRGQARRLGAPPEGASPWRQARRRTGKDPPSGRNRGWRGRAG